LNLFLPINMKTIVLTTFAVAQCVATEETKGAVMKPGLPKKIPSFPSNVYQVPLLQSNSQLPVSVDWSEEGNVVQPPPNQGQCGSCWSFAAAGALESAFAIANNEAPPKISEEELVDCVDFSEVPGWTGCDGGWIPTGLAYYSEKNACSEKSYPYDSGAWNVTTREPVFQCRQKDNCDVKIEGRVVTGIVMNSHGELGNVQDLKTAVALQPVAIQLFADPFNSYTKGVLPANEVACGGKNSDHAVLLVGYGQQDGVEYWKIRNSWGMAWGENGYIRIEIRDDQEGSLCMHTSPNNAYPLLSAGPSPPHPSCNADQPSSGQRMVWMEDANGHSTCQHHCKADGIHKHCAWCVYDINKCRRIYGDECDQGHVCPDNTMTV
jgi:cathepsin L